jgi:long-chain fatty acid transport protein
MKRSALITSFLVLFAAGKAYASTEINGLFDGRSAGMGGTGVAYLDSPGAIPTNPALLDQIGKLTISADVFYIISQPQSPYRVWHIDPATGNYYETYDTVISKSASAPLPFIGAAFRLNDRIVVGAAAYPVIAQGAQAEYRPAPDEYPNTVAVNKVGMALFEASIPVSIRITDKLALGVSWRITYMSQSINVPIDTFAPPAGISFNSAAGAPINTELKTTGVNFGGAQVGVLYRPVPSLRLGLTYRSKVIVSGSGTNTITLAGTQMDLEARNSYTNPHMFRAGLAWSVLNDHLLLALDFKYLLYAEAYKEIETITVMKTPTGSKESVNHRPLYWKNAYTVQVGAEYKLSDTFRARAGYILATSATTPDYALSYMAPPGNSHLVGGGLGIQVLENLKVDIAAAYVVLSSFVPKATMYNAGIGTYASHGAEISLAAVYHK